MEEVIKFVKAKASMIGRANQQRSIRESNAAEQQFEACTPLVKY
jgi:hypothetical protein